SYTTECSMGNVYPRKRISVLNIADILKKHKDTFGSIHNIQNDVRGSRSDAVQIGNGHTSHRPLNDYRSFQRRRIYLLRQVCDTGSISIITVDNYQ
ncbi:hypothetical protein PFISCL1PPCAC_19094, partial [Pristionchus fissidentatus]